MMQSLATPENNLQANMDMQQLLMSIDPTSAQEMFAQMSKGNLLAGGSASPSSLASSGAQSSSADANEDKEPTPQNQTAPWLNALIMQQQAQQQQQQQQQQNLNRAPSMNDLMEMSSLNNLGGNAQLAQLAAQLLQQQQQPQEENREEKMTGLIVPSTSKVTTTPSHGGVIVSQAATEDSETPPAKKMRTEEHDEEAAMKNALDNLLLAQMNSLQNCQTTPPHNSENGSASADSIDDQRQMKCPDCDKEFENTSYLEQHRLTQHGNLMAQRLFGGLFGGPQAMNFPLGLLQSPIHQQFNLGDMESPLLNTPKQSGGGVKRQYSSNGKNYCDLCNKEVCNKYFLRTHMLKMHGIVIDENKTVIANIDTLERERMGNLSFRCDTCMTEFKSRQQLRSHKQEVHGVLPLTPGNRSLPVKMSMPSTPTGVHTNQQNGLMAPPGLAEEKCQMCDKRVPGIMMPMHVQQEHMSPAAAQMQMAPDLSQVMALLSQATRANREEENKETSQVLRCTRCQYVTRDPRNLEMHQERHEPMNDAKRQGGEEDEDEALKMTTEAALKMVVANGLNSDEADQAQAALNLVLHKPMKKDGNDEEKAPNHDRNSHTSGSISPSGDSLPEGFGKTIGSEKPYPLQTFVVRSNDEKGCFLGEFLVQLPVRSIVDGPRQVLFELHPAPSQ